MRDRQAPAHELLDALLDGQPTAPAPQELAPLLQVAADLRRELAATGMSEDAVQRQLQQVLSRVRQVVPSANGHGGPAPLVSASPPADEAPSAGDNAGAPRWRDAGLRRRAAAAALAAALLLVPTGVASASALPGEPLYALKRAIEQVQVAAALTPAAKARVLTDLAGRRLAELERLLAERDTERLPHAIKELDRAVEEASEAVVEGGVRDATLVTELAAIQERSRQEIQELLAGPVPPEAEAAAEEALEDPPPAPTTAPPVQPSSDEPPPATTAPPATAPPSTTAPPTGGGQQGGRGNSGGSGQEGSTGTAPSTTAPPTSSPATSQSGGASGGAASAGTDAVETTGAGAGASVQGTQAGTEGT